MDRYNTFFQSHRGWLDRYIRSWIVKRDMRKTKQRSWIGNSGLGSLDYQKTIFHTGLGSLNFPTQNFHRSWIAKSGLWSLTEKNLLRRVDLGRNYCSIAQDLKFDWSTQITWKREAAGNTNIRWCRATPKLTNISAVIFSYLFGEGGLFS